MQLSLTYLAHSLLHAETSMPVFGLMLINYELHITLT